MESQRSGKGNSNKWFTIAIIILVGLLMAWIGRGKMDSQTVKKAMKALGFHGEAVTATSNWEWNAPNAPDVVNIRAQWGTSPGGTQSFLDVGNVTTAAIPYQEDGQPRWGRITAWNADGQESLPSNEIMFGSTPAPATPSPAPTATSTATSTPAATVAPTATATATATASATSTATIPPPSPSPTATATAAPTPTVTPSPSPDFSIIVTPTSRTVPSGVGTYSVATYLVTTTRTGGFNTLVMLKATGLPASVESSFTQNPTVMKRNLMLNVAGFVAPGTHTFTVTGRAGSLTRTATATLIVGP